MACVYGPRGVRIFCLVAAVVLSGFMLYDVLVGDASWWSAVIFVPLLLFSAAATAMQLTGYGESEGP